MTSRGYFMESDDEALRLDLKTDGKIVETQALWAGIKPGMRVADLGCGAGKTTFHLNKLVQPAGETVAVDMADQRIQYAKSHYSGNSISFLARDIRESLEDLGQFDFIWIRFVLEYYKVGCIEIVENACKVLKPGGILCLIDLDCNCLRFYGFPPRVEKTIRAISDLLEKNANFDAYVGVKLYSMIYDLGFVDIDVNVTPHNLIFGELRETDAFNMQKKVEVAGKIAGYPFDEYEGGFQEFCDEFEKSYLDPRRFVYMPLISCRGRKPH